MFGKYTLNDEREWRFEFRRRRVVRDSRRAPSIGLMSDPSTSTRPLRDDERALLDHLLSLDQPGFAELRQQALSAEVARSDANGFALVVPLAEPPAPIAHGPVVARAVDPSKDDYRFDVFLWITRGGYLEGVEVMWPDGSPGALPRPDELTAPMPV